ncbi:MAG: lysophospholipid acyltransferase family protein [Thermoanaerobaculia bacterium]
MRQRRGRLLYALLSILGAIVRPFPLRAARAIGIFLGNLGWLVLLRDKRKSLEHLAIAFPERADRERRNIAHDMFRHLGMSLMEILWLPNVNTGNLDRTTTVDNLEPIADLIRAGHGVVVFTAHCGNWEWLAYGTGLRCPNVTVLHRERDEAQINRFIIETRAGAGVHTIDRGSGGAGREMIQTLRRGGLLAFLIDHNIRTESVKIPFFGVPALTPIGPAKLAIRTESYVASAFVERVDGRQQIRFSDAVRMRRDDDPVALTARMTAEIEAQIRRRPEQWVWFHERWRERPQWDVTENFE